MVKVLDAERINELFRAVDLVCGECPYELDENLETQDCDRCNVRKLCKMLCFMDKDRVKTYEEVVEYVVGEICGQNRHIQPSQAKEFFGRVQKGPLYSPFLEAAVMYCEWESGQKVVDRTIEVVPISKRDLDARLHYYTPEGDTWAAGILADYDHLSLSLNLDEDWAKTVQTLASIAAQPDWVEDPTRITPAFSLRR